MMVLLLLSPTIWALPARHDSLLDYVQPGPDQGKTGTCLYVASTGAMELILNKRHAIKDPPVLGEFDLSEPFLIHAPHYAPRGKSFFENPVYKFNRGHAIHAKDWPLVAWNGEEVDMSAWYNQDYSRMPQIEVPQVQTIKLFNFENRWITGVLNVDHIERIKEALVKYNSPILINYNDNKFWHVILVVGYDDRIEGECYQLEDHNECLRTQGSFYVRDSFGKIIELRDYDWFIAKGNAAFVVKEVDSSL